ncbi:bifunctional diguanylate cyclase/phosphodiesterase [Pseudoxanthomonas broegbernensis]|nr:EAL domain-containing protein [Pseudoxanthomonas broegbernensis]
MPEAMDAAVPHAPALASPVWALLVLLAGLLLTGELARREWVDMHERAAAMHRSLADAVPGRLREPLATAALALRAMQTVFLSNDRMDQALFAYYHDNLRVRDRLPGYVVTAFARRQQDPAAERPSYRYAFVAPLQGNESLVDFDIAGQPENLAALEASRDADWPLASAPFDLLQFREAGGGQALGITLRVPVYSRGPAPVTVATRRAREIGALAISLRLEPMVRKALEGRTLESMHVDIRDLGAAPGHEAVFASAPVPDAGAQIQMRRIEFGGRRWELRMWPRSARVETGRLYLIVLAGSAISILLSLLLWSQSTIQRRALELGRRMSARFGESEARFRVLNELLPALVLLADGRDGRIAYANQAARQRLGEVAGAPLASLFADPEMGSTALEEAARGGGWASREAVIVGGGRRFWASASLARIEVEGAPCLLMVANDTSEQRELTERLRYQAAHDGLTELPNRREFERRLQQALAAGRERSAPFALLYIDLDQFKLINDVAGHMAGDQLLVQLVHAMHRELREGDLLARLGGDEFGLLAFGVDEEQAMALAEYMRRCIEGVAFVWQERAYTVSASIGVVLADRQGCTLKDLLAWADSACYQAKEEGRNRVWAYREDADTTRRHSEMEWVNRLRLALEQDRLLLDYQEVLPLDPASDDGLHIELLLRLREENGETVLPGAFLPAAERYGLMPALDRWVIRTALAHFGGLHPQGDRLRTCAINLSGASIEDEDLAEFILATMDEFAVPAQRLCLEITETVAVRSLLKVVRVIERLRTAGCRIALDDFGAGMSSFGYLKNLPVDMIKIDGSFVRDLGSDPMSRVIVNAVAQIGHQRGLKVVAEWVSDERTLGVLRGLEVDYGQGFLLHRPERVVFQRRRDEGGTGR